LCGTGAKQITFDKVPLGRRPNMHPKMPTSRCALAASETAAGRRNVTRVYERVTSRSSGLGRMERRGVKVDREYLARLQPDFSERDRSARGTHLRGCLRAIHDRIAAAARRGALRRLGLKGGRKGKSGQYSTDVNELERLASEGVECATLVLEWRQLTKLKSTYTDALQAQINPETGRGSHQLFVDRRPDLADCHRTTPICRTSRSGRSWGRKIRDAFVAETGFKLLSADYSQIELRLAARTWPTSQLSNRHSAKRRHP
jgi:DNA polymerase-1